VKTSHKLVWLCGYIDPATPKDCSLLAIPTTKAVYHGFWKDRLILCPVPNLPDPDQYPELINPCIWRFPSPPSRTINALYQWTCSKASLCGVRRARRSKRGGLHLEYNGFDVYLGDFQPSEALAWTTAPGWLKISTVSELEQNVDFYMTSDGCASELFPMEGNILVWSCRNGFLVQLDRD
jgi:hypothetical protein